KRQDPSADASPLGDGQAQTFRAPKEGHYQTVYRPVKVDAHPMLSVQPTEEVRSMMSTPKDEFQTSEQEPSEPQPSAMLRNEANIAMIVQAVSRLILCCAGRHNDFESDSTATKGHTDENGSDLAWMAVAGGIEMPGPHTFYDGATMLQPIATYFGVQVDRINFVLCMFSSLPLAYIFKRFCAPGVVTRQTRTVFPLIIGVMFCFFCFGRASKHLLSNALLKLCMVWFCAAGPAHRPKHVH
ncbi:hypothetical protein OSTOST_07452, partial [Ostertagia ostertagi]